MVLKIIISILAILGLVFVVAPFFNYAAFDFQCQTSGCSGQICSANTILPSKDTTTTCEFRTEDGCNKNCEVRKWKCSFDLDFKQSCESCVSDCKTAIDEEQPQCFEKCYNISNSE